MGQAEVDLCLLRDRRSPYIPDVKNSWDTQNFDPYEEEEPWVPSDLKAQKGKKKNPEFIGYTYKPIEESNSALVRALVDLDNYKPPASKPLDYLQLERIENPNSHPLSANLFKKKEDKTDRVSKEFAATTALATAKKAEEKEKERYKYYYGDTPEKKPSPAFFRKSPKQSLKQSSKISPSNKGGEEKKVKMKVLQKKLI